MSVDSADSASQLNATPLIDVLLVLIVMLVMTLPIATHAVKLNLPHAPHGTPPPSVRLDIDFDGEIFWNGQHVAGLTALASRLSSLASSAARSPVDVHPDKRAPYERVAQVLATAQRLGVSGLSVAPVRD